MPRQEIIPQSDAATDRFESIEAPRTLFSIDARVSDITLGSPTYTILVSNVYEGTLADFKEYLPETTNVPITQAIEFQDLPFQFIGVQYNSNASTGTYIFYCFSI